MHCPCVYPRSHDDKIPESKKRGKQKREGEKEVWLLAEGRRGGGGAKEGKRSANRKGGLPKAWQPGQVLVPNGHFPYPETVCYEEMQKI